MAKPAKVEVLDPEPASTSIALQVTRDPGIVLLDREKFDAFYEGLRAKAPTDADVSTKKGRDELRSFAADVRSTKAGIDKARLALTKQWRDMTAQANTAGKEIEERLEGLAVEVRRPLTEWEDAEKARIETCRAVIDGLKAMARVDLDDTAATVRERGSVAFKTELDPDQFGDMLDEAKSAKEAAVEALKAALARLTREEEERAELERLRKEQAERDAREAAEREERERAERERLAAAEAERRRVEAEAAEAERVRQAEERAAEAARDEEARKAREAEQERQRQHEAALAEERRQREEAERQVREAREAAEAEAAAQAKREADQKHRAKVMGAAKEAIMTCGVDEETARKIVLLIRSGEVPNVRLEF